MFLVTKEFRFEAAHRLSHAYTEKCKAIHGHNYKVEVTFSCPKLNHDGMVIDFGKVKQACKDLFENWDHRCIEPNDGNVLVNDIVLEWNPTAENMAVAMFGAISDIVGRLIKESEELDKHGFERNLKVHSVKVWETETSSATYTI